MSDPLLDDVKSLLDKDFGDDRILKQICRACENNEVISNYERNYVRKLAEKHLGRKPEITHVTVEEKYTVPDVVLSEIPKNQLVQHKPLNKSSNSKNPKIILGVGGIALAIIIVIAVSFTGVTDNPATKVEISNSIATDVLSIQTDLPSYTNNDLISISGASNISGNVDLSIKNPSGELVWAEQVSINSSGMYATLTIAGGSGWSNSGTYTISVDNSVDVKSSTFLFSK